MKVNGLVCPDCGQPAIHSTEACCCEVIRQRDLWQATTIALAAWIASNKRKAVDQRPVIEQNSRRQQQ